MADIEQERLLFARVLLSWPRCEAPRLWLKNVCEMKSLVFNGGHFFFSDVLYVTCTKIPLKVASNWRKNSIAGGIIVQLRINCLITVDDFFFWRHQVIFIWASDLHRPILYSMGLDRFNTVLYKICLILLILPPKYYRTDLSM